MKRETVLRPNRPSRCSHSTQMSYPALSGVPYSVTAKKRLVNREMRILNGGPTAGLPPTAFPIVGHHHPCGMGPSPLGHPCDIKADLVHSGPPPSPPQSRNISAGWEMFLQRHGSSKNGWAQRASESSHELFSSTDGGSDCLTERNGGSDTTMPSVWRRMRAR